MSRIARNEAGAIRRRGTPIVLRVNGMSAGDMPNPPTLVNPVLDGAVAAGATMLAIRASSAWGYLAAGDVLTFGGQSVTLAADAPSRAPDAAVPVFDRVQVSTLAADVADGTAVAVAYGADVAVFAVIQSYPLRLVDGLMILAADLDVTLPVMAADGTPLALPSPTDQVIIGGDIRSIVSAQPAYVQGEVVKYQVQAR